jgi:zinc transport system substrate-binding protein
MEAAWMLRYNVRSGLATRAVCVTAPAALLLAAVLVAMLGAARPARAADAPLVVASIQPVHALAAAVMAGVGTPALLVHGGGSPHAYSLRPSDARALDAAQVVFWVGPGLELFLRKPLGALAGRARVEALAEAPGVARLPQREGGLWGQHADAHAGEGHAAYNPHVWLDPRNAQAMTARMAEVLAQADPSHAATYRANAARLRGRLAALEAELAQRLAPLRGRPYLVFHDAYAYLEARYGLEAVGAIAVTPEQAPGARRVSELRAHIRSSGAVCVFAEPQFQPRLLATLLEGTPARGGVLDPLGAALSPGPELYFALMRGLADSLAGCLAPR